MVPAKNLSSQPAVIDEQDLPQQPCALQSAAVRVANWQRHAVKGTSQLQDSDPSTQQRTKTASRSSRYQRTKTLVAASAPARGSSIHACSHFQVETIVCSCPLPCSVSNRPSAATISTAMPAAAGLQSSPSACSWHATPLQGCHWFVSPLGPLTTANAMLPFPASSASPQSGTLHRAASSGGLVRPAHRP
jgi:type VI protein secretion system component VasA